MNRKEYEHNWKQCHSSSEHVDVCEEYINSLEQEISTLTMKVKAQDIIIRDKTAFIEAMSLQLKEISHRRISNNSNNQTNLQR